MIMVLQPAIQSRGRGGGSPPQDRKIHGGSSSMDHRDALDKIIIKQWRWWKLAGVLLAVIWLECLLVAIPASASAPTAAFSSNVTGGLSPLPVQFTDSSSGSPTGWTWFFGDGLYNQPWTQTTAAASWSARFIQSSVVTANGSIILTGGYDGSIYYNDTWISLNNGSSWTNLTASSGWSGRYGHSTVVMPNGDIILMGGANKTPSVGDNNETWKSTTNGASWTLVNASSGWTQRDRFSSVVAPDGSIILMGGENSGSTPNNEVWQSTNEGSTWTEITASASWVARTGHTSVVAPDGAIVIMGGYNGGSNYYNDVWKSYNDGLTWTETTTNAGWAPRYIFTSDIMPDGSILTLGGRNGSSTLENDVWRSPLNSDGASWTEVNASAGWAARRGLSSVVIPNGSVVVMGGSTGSNQHDVWQFQPSISQAKNPIYTFTGTAGTTFSVAEQVYTTGISGAVNNTIKSAYITLYAIPSASFTEQLTTGQGQRYATFTDTSTGPPTSWNWMNNGVTFSTLQNPTYLFTSGNNSITEQVTNPEGTSTSAVQWVNVSAVSAAFSGTPLSGTSPLTTIFTDTSTGLPSVFSWFFGDETYSQPWINTTGSPGWLGRWEQSTVVMPDGSIVLMGGWYHVSPTKFLNDVWRSTDEGVTWVQQTASAAWSQRNDFPSVAMPDGSIVLMGGNTQNATGFSSWSNETWRSVTEGSTWSLMNASSGWMASEGAASVVTPNGLILFMGGWADPTPSTDNNPSVLGNDTNYIWGSPNNGATWAEINSNPPWQPREGFGLVMLPDGNIVLMGGSYTLNHDATYTYLNDVWRSTDDGMTWTEMNVSASWAARAPCECVAMPDGSIVLGGGHNSINSFSDLWRSTDEGKTWIQIPNPSWIGRGGYQNDRVMPDGSIVLIGGYNSTSNIYFNDTWRMQPVGSNLKNPQHTYVNTGGSPVMYNVSEMIWNAASGSNTLLKSNYIAQDSSTVVTSFTQNITQGYAPLVVQFSDTSSYETSNNWSWGDGTYTLNTQNPTHTYSSTGQYTISLTATNSYGSNTKTGTVLVNVLNTPTPTPVPSPVAAFTQNITYGYVPLTVQFYDTSGNSPTQWNWSWGDNTWTNGSTQNPTHTYSGAGQYTVSLISSNSGGSSTVTESNLITAIAVVTPTPTPTPAIGTQFTGSPQVGTNATVIGFTDLSTNSPTAWNWSFGDGTYSTAQNPTHVYSLFGTYTVSLNASTTTQYAINTKTNYIAISQTVPIIITSFSGTPTSGTVSFPVTFTDTSIYSPYAPTAWLWNFGDGYTSTSASPAHIYNTPGTYTVTLTNSNAYTSNSSTLAGYISATAPLPSTGFVKWISNNATFITVDINRANYGALTLYNPQNNPPTLLSVSQLLQSQPDGTTWDMIPWQAGIEFTGDDGSNWIYWSQ